MKSKLKIVSLLLVLVLVLAGCSNNKDQANGHNEESSSPAVENNQEQEASQDQQQEASQDQQQEQSQNQQAQAESTREDRVSQVEDLDLLGLPTALELALNDLGLSEDQLLILEMSYDRDSQANEDIYDIDLYLDSTKYQYEITKDFTIKEKSEESKNISVPNTDKFMLNEELLALSLDHTGLESNQVKEFSLDLDYGNTLIYEVEIKSIDGSEFEFKIDPVSGQIL